ncbi:adenine nucleotide alpha hydrolases-like protein [Lentinus tigrinus ALCF2SS1-6]|uniref:tRNA(Ile)-lysidine synthetase n=1 Tax=Lentinus tigrinus ALCF2SS1-6 TaxID=1328759 RepID=A0A5C2T1U1_9APHY|nr:adenine nucleotide alpha hydrolases-like protein [Lentinus tigrinus ALCF2SS1-6]
MRPVAPITPAEFFHLLQRCIPPVGWPTKLSNSGGPDSTALLFLLTATVRDRSGLQERAPSLSWLNNTGLFREIISIHVNHDLQPAARSMEATAANNARLCGAPSVVEKIQWGHPPFPSQPGDGTAGEKVAREARYNRLFGAMQWIKSNVIAFAHHADDQVETVVMRMSQGSSPRGLAGMRPVRRWGMGQRDSKLYSFGANGMRSWIVRPLLHVPKDRLLATCEANGLDYVNDPTNFQPALTLRNAIRKELSKKAPYVSEATSQAPTVDITPYVYKLRAIVPDVAPAEQPREAVRRLGIRLEEVETQVTEILNRARLPSPPSTLLLASSALAEATDKTVRTELIRRCLRFVSPGPWGSLWAEGHGDRDTYQRIANQLWPPFFTSLLERRPFTAGAGVAANPVAIPRNPGRRAVRFSAPEKGEADGWLLSRAEPYQKTKSMADLSTLVDVTDALVHAMNNPRGRGGYSLLYDNRFFIDFDLEHMPWDVAKEILARNARVTVRPETRWFLPNVTIDGKTPREIGRLFWKIDGWQQPRRPPLQQSWIKMKFVRTLDAI